MKITLNGDTLTASDINELATMSVNSFHTELGAAMPVGLKQIDVDLSRTGFVDCAGLGALISLRKRAGGPNGAVRIRVLNPPPAVQRMLNLMKLDQMVGGNEQCEGGSEQ
jgi:anti-anti-sigma regulatory factor